MSEASPSQSIVVTSQFYQITNLKYTSCNFIVQAFLHPMIFISTLHVVQKLTDMVHLYKTKIDIFITARGIK